MQYLENTPWTGELFHPVTGILLVENGEVNIDLVAAYWEIPAEEPGFKKGIQNPVATNHLQWESWWERVKDQYPNLNLDEFYELLYCIDFGAGFIWDNFICFEAREIEPETRHILIYVLDPTKDEENHIPDDYKLSTT